MAWNAHLAIIYVRTLHMKHGRTQFSSLTVKSHLKIAAIYLLTFINKRNTFSSIIVFSSLEIVFSSCIYHGVDVCLCLRAFRYHLQ